MKEETEYINEPISGRHLDENELAACADWINGMAEEPGLSVQEHLKGCESCKMAVLDVSEFDSSQKPYFDTGTRSSKSFEETCAAKYSPSIKSSGGNHFWRVAAVFFVLVSVTVAALLLKPHRGPALVDNLKNGDSLEQVQENNQGKVINIVRDTTETRDSVARSNIEIVEKERFASNFNPNPAYEALIGAQFRASGQPEILSPGKDTSLISGSILAFTARNPGKEMLEIQILDNQARLVRSFKDLYSVDFKVKLDLNPGLYYWKLMSTDEIHQAGRIRLEKTPGPGDN